MERPKCFRSTEQWKLWREMYDEAPISGPAEDWYCVDCTPEFQERMKRVLCCEHPEVRFITIPSEDGLVEIGVREGQASVIWKTLGVQPKLFDE